MFIQLSQMLFRPLRQIADKFNTLQMGMVASERVFKVLDTDSIIEDKGLKTIDNLEGSIEFKNVWFAYNDEDWVLKDVSFKIKAGETLALVGATGAGKSSIINLLTRNYEINKGAIFIDGVNYLDYDLNSLRKNVAVVLQDVFLFSDTIFNNIRLGNVNASEQEVIEAAKIANAHEFIKATENGYNTNIGDSGNKLSGGQKQRLSIARAILKNPEILILDEATSSLDTESERLVQDALNKLMHSRTSLVIAHRLSTIQNADEILVLEKGCIIERGTHQDLITQNGHYKKLSDLQSFA